MADKNEIVKKETEAKSAVTPLASIDFSKSRKQKSENDTNRGLSLTERALIHQGLLNLGNELVKPKDETDWTEITYGKWLDIVDAFKNDIPENVQHGWRNKTNRAKTTFLHQSDEFIFSFHQLKVESLVGANIITQRMILTDKGQKAMFQLTGIGGKWTPSKMPVTYLAYFKSFSFKELGLSHKMKIAQMNNKQVEFFLKE